MKNATVLVPLVLALALLTGGATIDAYATSGEEPRALTLIDVTDEQEELVAWAVALYAEAGLDLPPLVVQRHADTAPCHGRNGAATPRDGIVQIDLCIDTARPVDEMLVLHELAHAWDRHAVTDETRTVFLAIRGLDSWRGAGVEWNRRGAEHLAEIMVWGLIDRPVRPGYIEQNSCAELHAGYLVLTGADPLHGYTDLCA